MVDWETFDWADSAVIHARAASGAMPIMDHSEYRDLVLGIYQAVSDPDEWQTVLDRITDSVSARGGMIFEWHLRGDERRLEVPLMSSSYDRTIVEEYFRRFHNWEAEDHDAFEQSLMASDGIDILSEEILYNKEEEYLKRPHVRELLAQGIRYRTGALLDKDNPFRARFSLSMGAERGPFTDEDVAFLKSLLPHLAKAMDLARPLGNPGEEHAALLAVMERLKVGICLLDGLGRIVASNSEFDRQVEAYRAFGPDIQGRLRLNQPAAQGEFRVMLEDALNHGRFGARPRKEAIVIGGDGTAGSLCFEIVPLDRSKEIGSRAFQGALAISRDLGQAVSIDVDLAKRAFELTATETTIVSLVSEGLTNAEIAERRERSVETVNAQMKSILGKTRAVNRTQLVRLLCSFSLPGSYLLR